MVDPRPGPGTRRHHPEGPLLGEAGLGPFAPHAFGETPDRLGRQRRGSSATTTGKRKKLLDRCPASGFGHSQEASCTIARKTGDPRTVAVRAKAIRVTTQQRGHCDGNFKRLEKGSYRFPAAADGAEHVEVRAADLVMLLAGVDLASVRRSRRYHRPVPRRTA